MMEALEADSSNSDVVACRAACEVRAMQIVAMMGLERDGKRELWIPKTGGRILTHGKGCVRQVPHMDFELARFAEEEYTAPTDVSYSAIWTDCDALPLIVYDHSHKLMQGPSKHTLMIAKCLPPRRVIIPPYSCMILRGDLVHCGAGDDDSTEKEKEARKRERVIRFHVYIGRQKQERRSLKDRIPPSSLDFPDSIHFYTPFYPRPAKSDSWK